MNIPASLPTGTVSFLFTDIQGSTPLWERSPEKMAQALQIHNQALRQAIEVHGGVVFKFIGDEFQAAFPTATQALMAAIEAQRLLKAAAWNELGALKVRMGLHTGEAQLDPGGDEYAVSHTKNRAGRIRSAAHGGQVLLSQECEDLVRRALPEGVTLQDLGEYHLKGMDIPERLYQVNVPGLQQNFPPLELSIVRPNNLPVERTTFIGREKETEALKRLLEKDRLVTLTGSGGTGKTRLSLHVAAAMLDQYPKGAWLVELAPLADPLLVPSSVGQALGLPEIPGKSIEQALVDFLREKRLLLILDNCEHLLEACAGFSNRLLSACQGLTILASSREILGVEGEAPFRVPPLSMPDPRNLPSLERIVDFDAVRLFVERAGVASPGFALEESNASQVIQIVQRLDGIPLAIELAAARLKLLGVDQLLERLSDTFRLLTGGSRTALPRHQTLRACIDWSYNLLSEPERVLLRRISVFAGGWSLHAVEEVCGEGVIDADIILDLLSELLDKSLISAEPASGGRHRYRMLETVRQYAHEKLVDQGEAEVLRSRHLDFFVRFTEAQEPKIRSREQIKTLDRLELEVDNLRLALEWGLQTDVLAELKIAAALKFFWHIHHHTLEGIEWLERGLARLAGMQPNGPQSEDHLFIRAKAQGVLGFHNYFLYISKGNQPTYLENCRKALEESISIYQSLSEKFGLAARRGLGWALLWLGWHQGMIGDSAECTRLLHDAFDLFRETCDIHGMAESLQLIGAIEFDPHKKKSLHLEMLALERDNGDVDGIATALIYLGLDYFINADYEQSLAAYKDSLTYYEQVKNRVMIAFLWDYQGVVLYALGKLQQARECYKQSLVFSKEFGIESGQISALRGLADIEMTEGRLIQAGEWLEQATSVEKKIGRVYEPELDYHRLRLARLSSNPNLARKLGLEIISKQDIAEFQKIFPLLELGHFALENGDDKQAGEFWWEAVQIQIRRQEPMWLFIFYDALGLLASRQGEAERAVLFFGSRWARGCFNYLSPNERVLREAELVKLRVALGSERFVQLYEEGRRMTFQQMIDLASAGFGSSTTP